MTSIKRSFERAFILFDTAPFAVALESIGITVRFAMRIVVDASSIGRPKILDLLSFFEVSFQLDRFARLKRNRRFVLPFGCFSLLMRFRRRAGRFSRVIV